MAEISRAEIPIIDFSAFSTADRATQLKVAAQINQACQTFGFFYLHQTGVSAIQIDQTFAQTKAFFDLPLALKTQVSRSPETNCGYLPLASERLNPARLGDLKEAFNIGDHTLWPTEPSQFRPVVELFYQTCIQQVALPLLQALALALQLPDTFFIDRHGKNFFLRLLHYPAVEQAAANQLRAGEHTDYGTVTLLFQEPDAVGGLEIDAQGHWMPAPVIRDTILVNIGDALQRWTNHRFCSTPHRVVFPEGVNSRRSRYSMALFCDPNPDVEIACLPTCQTADAPPLDPPIRYQDYLQSRFAATY
ncbi:MAG: isopenicillin N synthase family oxygenase [Cyanobacteria bacterium RM1_2_2]|nr:isopenicillin N synthase family oxygenase [Cyanobacteria bacterium RM1_2_2]